MRVRRDVDKRFHISSVSEKTLQEFQRTQIITRLAEAAASEPSYQFAMHDNTVRRHSPIAPSKKIVGEGEPRRIFVLEHFRDLFLGPIVFQREDRRPEHVEKAVHFCLNTVVEEPDWMMEARGEFYRHLVRARADENIRDVPGGREGIRADPAGPEFESEFPV